MAFLNLRVSKRRKHEETEQRYSLKNIRDSSEIHDLIQLLQKQQANNVYFGMLTKFLN